jgi:hypothetical protein
VEAVVRYNHLVPILGRVLLVECLIVGVGEAPNVGISMDLAIVGVEDIQVLEAVSLTNGSLRLVLLFLVVLCEDADGVVRLLDDGHLRQDARLELPLLLIVGLLVNVLNPEPRVFKQVLRRGTRVVVDVKAALQDVQVLACNLLVVDVVRASPNAPVEVIVSLASERETAIEQRVEKDSSRPNVCRRARILDLGDNLRRHVRGRATEHADLLVVRDTGREAKVNQFDVFVLVEKNVLQLDVSVGNAFAVAVP